MATSIESIATIKDLQDNNVANLEHQSVESLESGEVIYFPKLAFPLDEQQRVFVSGKYTSPKSKNISYDVRTGNVKGLPEELRTDTDEITQLQQMLDRFARFAINLVLRVAPSYVDTLEFGRTSFRPAQVEGRKPSVRKNDALLHVDSFPSTPVQGKRILRVFSNINPSGEGRVWHVGRRLDQVIEQFAPHISPPIPGAATLLRLLHITKSRRSAYDHYMLRLEDAMRADEVFQRSAIEARREFPAGSSWLCFTDQVSHAALSGQFALEQTFYLPVTGMKNPDTSPLRQWEARLGRCLA